MSFTIEKIGKAFPYGVAKEYDKEIVLSDADDAPVVHVFKDDTGHIAYQEVLDKDSRLTLQYEMQEEPNTVAVRIWHTAPDASGTTPPTKYGKATIEEGTDAGTIARTNPVGKWEERTAEGLVSYGEYDCTYRKNGIWKTPNPADTDKETWVSYINGRVYRHMGEVSLSVLKEAANAVGSVETSPVSSLGRGHPRHVAAEYDVEAVRAPNQDLLAFPVLLYKDNKGNVCYQEHRDFQGYVEMQLNLTDITNETATLSAWFDLQRWEMTAPPSETQRVKITGRSEHGLTFFEALKA